MLAGSLDGGLMMYDVVALGGIFGDIWSWRRCVRVAQTDNRLTDQLTGWMHDLRAMKARLATTRRPHRLQTVDWLARACWLVN